MAQSAVKKNNIDVYDMLMECIQMGSAQGGGGRREEGAKLPAAAGEWAAEEEKPVAQGGVRERGVPVAQDEPIVRVQLVARWRAGSKSRGCRRHLEKGSGSGTQNPEGNEEAPRKKAGQKGTDPNREQSAPPVCLTNRCVPAATPPR